MKKKLEIATSLAHNPKLLILDEPTSGLDPIVRGEVLDIFREFMENDEHSILISSHITSDLENIADYIVLIDNGKIILNKSIMDITDNYGIIHCTKEMFEKLKNKAMNYRKNKYDYEVLIDNKKEIKREYKDLNIDKANIFIIRVQIHIRNQTIIISGNAGINNFLRRKFFLLSMKFIQPPFQQDRIYNFSELSNQ